MRLTALALGLAMAVTWALPSGAAVPDGATWTDATFPSADGESLHAEILRPAQLPPDQPTPVIMSVSPYVGRGGQHVDYNPAPDGPSTRFDEFLTLGRVFERGYTFVMVNLPGYGGSSGCGDQGGPAEQAAVVSAVEWAAQQPWSNGRIGLIGTSYDAWTGLMAIANQPAGLAAVLAMEPVYSGYDYVWQDGMPRWTLPVFPASYVAYDAKPGPLNDPDHTLAGTAEGGCYPASLTGSYDPDPTTTYWRERDLLPPSAGATTPLFLTQGFLELNTRPYLAYEYFNALGGSDNRAWFGQFDHRSGWEQTGGRPHNGRGDFMDEAMAFFAGHLTGDPVAHAAAPRGVAVQDGDGRWREEPVWPPADALTHTTRLRTGSYLDDGRNTATEGAGIWSVSPVLPHDAWFAGEAHLTVAAGSPAGAGVAGDIYDVQPDGTAVLITRAAGRLVDGTARIRFYGQDWVIPAGHRLAVLVSGANREEWIPQPTLASVTVSAATIELPWLTYLRDGQFVAGTSTPRLEEHRATQVHPLTEQEIAEATVEFTIPRPLAPRPGPAVAGGR